MDKDLLLSAIDAYIEKMGCSDSTASNKLMGSGNWLKQVRGGMGFTLKTYNKIIAKLNDQGIEIRNGEVVVSQ